MATKLFPRSSASAHSTTTITHAVTYQELLLTQGASVASDVRNTTSTVLESGPVPSHGSAVQPWGTDTTSSLAAGVENWNSGTIVFVSNPLTAVTISGSISANIRALESNAMANYGVGFTVFKIASGNGAATEIAGDGAMSTTELGTSEAARTPSVTPGASVSLANGDMLGAVIWFCAAGGSNASGFTATGFYNGASGATGDTFLTFTESITEQAAGTTYTKSGFGAEHG